MLKFKPLCSSFMIDLVSHIALQPLLCILGKYLVTELSFFVKPLKNQNLW